MDTRLVDERGDDGRTRHRHAGNGDPVAWPAERSAALSDRGSQHTSEASSGLVAGHGVTCSLSRSGNIWDNAAMESFFSSLKVERVARKV